MKGLVFKHLTTITLLKTVRISLLFIGILTRLFIDIYSASKSFNYILGKILAVGVEALMTDLRVFRIMPVCRPRVQCYQYRYNWLIN